MVFSPTGLGGDLDVSKDDFWADGKQNASRAIWQGAFLSLPAALLWWLDLSFPVQGQLALGAVGYLLVAAGFAYVLRGRKTTTERLEQKMEQALERVHTMLESEEGDLRQDQARVDKAYRRLQENLDWALNRQMVFVEHKQGRVDEWPMGLDRSLEATGSSLGEWHAAISDISSRVADLTRQPMRESSFSLPGHFEHGDVAGIKRLKAEVDLEMAAFQQFLNDAKGHLGLS